MWHTTGASCVREQAPLGPANNNCQMTFLRVFKQELPVMIRYLPLHTCRTQQEAPRLSPPHLILWCEAPPHHLCSAHTSWVVERSLHAPSNQQPHVVSLPFPGSTPRHEALRPCQTTSPPAHTLSWWCSDCCMNSHIISCVLRLSQPSDVEHGT